MSQAHRRDLWSGLVGLLAGLMLYLSVGYIVAGDAAASSPTFIVLREVPGGMRTAGVVQAACGLLLVYGLTTGPRSTGVRRALLLTFCVNLLWASTILAAWVLLWNVPAWGAPALTGGLAGMALLALRRQPSTTSHVLVLRERRTVDHGRSPERRVGATGDA